MAPEHTTRLTNGCLANLLIEFNLVENASSISGSRSLSSRR